MSDLVVAGYTGSSDFPTTPGACGTSFNGGLDAFVANVSAGNAADMLESSTPRVVGLCPGLPSPSIGGVIIHYEPAQETDVVLRICDAAGRRASALIAGTHPAGMHEVIWDGRNRVGRRVGAGIQLVQRRAGRGHTRKMMMVGEWPDQRRTRPCP